MNTTTAFLAGVALGAGLMYVLDPDRGNRRRALARDQVVSAAHSVEHTVGGRSMDIRNRATGMVHEARARMSEGDVDDRVLEERVRSEIGHAAKHTGAVQVLATQGRITLSGPALKSEVDSIMSSASSVRGVKGVENRLDVHDAPGVVSALQD